MTKYESLSDQIERYLKLRKPNNRDDVWYCPYCDEYLYPEEVTYEETHDPRCGGCGYPVQGPPDPPYDHTGHDTLEEKYL